MRAGILAALAFLCVSQTATAGETRIAEDGLESPPATFKDAAWLQGQWGGEGLGAPVYESWLPVAGGAVVGAFVLEDGKGAVRVSEFRYLTEEGGSLRLRIKHFEPDFTAREGRNEAIDLPLVAVEPCALYFNRVTFRCDGEGRMLVAARIKSDSPEPQEVIFHYERLSGSD